MKLQKKCSENIQYSLSQWDDEPTHFFFQNVKQKMSLQIDF